MNLQTYCLRPVEWYTTGINFKTIILSKVYETNIHKASCLSSVSNAAESYLGAAEPSLPYLFTAFSKTPEIPYKIIRIIP